MCVVQSNFLVVKYAHSSKDNFVKLIENSVPSKLLVTDQSSPPAGALSLLITPDSISKSYLIAMNLLSQIGIIGLWLSLVASVWSATQYTGTFIEKLKKIKKK